MVNEIARHVVERYLKLEAPKYALLVDAPWGSGKTHFISEVTNWEKDHTRLYLSLYGVHSAEEFDWALVRAMNPWAGEGFGNFTARTKEFLSGLTVLGCSVDLNKVNTTEIALNDLPQTLVFDDVERCDLPVKQLMGLINRFVEHEGKRVILVANSDKHAELPDFLKTREKLVGQVVTIQADVDVAIAEALAKLPEGQGRTFLTEHQGVIKETFEEAGHQNLRLLMRAMRDAVGPLDDIKPDMVAFVGPMERLLRTFLALHMAYHGGNISKEIIRDRTRTGYDNAEAKRRAREEFWDHPDADEAATDYDEVLYDTSFLSEDLGYRLIVDGFATAEQINEALRLTGQFALPAERPDWLRLWYMHEESEAEYEAVEARLDAVLASKEIVEPGQILHIYQARAKLGNYWDDFDAQGHAWKFCKYICDLSDEGLLPAKRVDMSGFDSGYDFDAFLGSISYQGHSFDVDKWSAFLANFLRKAMDRALEHKIENLAEELMIQFVSAPEGFRKRLQRREDGGEFWNISILHHLDFAKVAEIWMTLMEKDRQQAIAVLQLFADRIATGNARMDKERNWLPKLYQCLVEEANMISPMRVAQVRRIIKACQ